MRRGHNTQPEDARSTSNPATLSRVTHARIIVRLRMYNTLPSDTQPSDTQYGDTRPCDSQTVDTQPGDTQPNDERLKPSPVIPSPVKLTSQITLVQ